MTITIELTDAIMQMLRELSGSRDAPEKEAESILRNAYLLWVAGRESGLRRAQEVIGKPGFRCTPDFDEELEQTFGPREVPRRES